MRNFTKWWKGVTGEWREKKRKSTHTASGITTIYSVLNAESSSWCYQFSLSWIMFTRDLFAESTEQCNFGQAHNLSESQFPQPWNTDETSISKDSLDKAKIKHIEVLCELQIVTQCQLILILLLTLLLRPGRSSTKSPFTPGWVVETTGKDQYLWEKSHRILSSFSLRMVTACTRRCSHKHNPVILKHNGM